MGTRKYGLPVVVILLANAILIIRVVWQKHRRQQPISWLKQRRVPLQLLNISCLYIIAWLPNTIIVVMQQTNESSSVGEFQPNYIFDLIYLVCLLIPWICIKMLLEFKNWMLKRVYHKINSTKHCCIHKKELYNQI